MHMRSSINKMLRGPNNKETSYNLVHGAIAWIIKKKISSKQKLSQDMTWGYYQRHQWPWINILRDMIVLQTILYTVVISSTVIIQVLETESCQYQELISSSVCFYPIKPINDKRDKSLLANILDKRSPSKFYKDIAMTVSQYYG